MVRPSSLRSPRWLRSPCGPCVLLLACVAITGCGNPGPYANWKRYESPGGEYRLRYLDPPWEVIESEGTRVRMRVKNNAESFGGIDSSVASKYDLVVDVVARDPMRGAEGARATARGLGEEILEPVRPLTTRSGAQGFEVITRQTTGEHLYHRYSFVGRPGGGSVSLSFQAVPTLDEAEVDEMVRSVDPDPGGG